MAPFRGGLILHLNPPTISFPNHSFAKHPLHLTSLPFPSIGSRRPRPLASRDVPRLAAPAPACSPAPVPRHHAGEHTRPGAAPPRPPSATSWRCSSMGALRSVPRHQLRGPAAALRHPCFSKIELQEAARRKERRSSVAAAQESLAHAVCL